MRLVLAAQQLREDFWKKVVPPIPVDCTRPFLPDELVLLLDIKWTNEPLQSLPKVCLLFNNYVFSIMWILFVLILCPFLALYRSLSVLIALILSVIARR